MSDEAMNSSQLKLAIIKPVTIWMRLNLLSSTVLCFFAGLSLFVATEQTDQYSAWTITSPITAAFIGAAYWGAGVFLTLLSARERNWARARIAVPATFVFGLAGLASTLLHLDRFHTNSSNLFTVVLTYVWLIPYAIGWLFATVITINQIRTPGGDPPREKPLPGWLRIVLAVQAVVLLLVGLSLFIAPDTASTLWPWALTPLTAQVTAAWLLGLGVGAAHTVWENDFSRTYAAAVSYTLFSVLEFVVLLRYPNSINWGTAQAWIYLVFLVSLLGAGVYTWYRAGFLPARRPSAERQVSSSA
jgi:hypothetical protein